jgi:hypothetical protein
MRVVLFSNILSLGIPMILRRVALSGLNSWPGWDVTTAIAVVES